MRECVPHRRVQARLGVVPLAELGEVRHAEGLDTRPMQFECFGRYRPFERGEPLSQLSASSRGREDAVQVRTCDQVTCQGLDGTLGVLFAVLSFRVLGVRDRLEPEIWHGPVPGAHEARGREAVELHVPELFEPAKVLLETEKAREMHGGLMDSMRLYHSLSAPYRPIKGSHGFHAEIGLDDIPVELAI